MQIENISIKNTDSLAIMQWVGTISGEEYRQGHNAFLNLLESNPQKYWLLNYEKGNKILPEDQQWTVEEWIPKALKLFPKEISKIAVVVAKDIFNKVAVRIITTHIWKQDIEVAFFDSETDAKAWLLPNSPNHS